MTNIYSQRRERLACLVVSKASSFDSYERHKIWMFMLRRKVRRHCLSAFPVMAQAILLGSMVWVVTGGDIYIAALVYCIRVVMGRIPLGAKLVQNP